MSDRLLFIGDLRNGVSDRLDRERDRSAGGRRSSAAWRGAPLVAGGGLGEGDLDRLLNGILHDQM